MKNISLFIIFFPLFVIPAFSQPSWLPSAPTGTTPLILIRNNQNNRFLIIKQGVWIEVSTKNGLEISGTVKKIVADTLFLPATRVRVADIDTLYLKMRPSPGDLLKPGHRKPSYVAGSPDWQIICPPDSVFRYANKWHNYLYRLRHVANGERQETRNPLITKNFLKWNVSKLAHLEVAFSYERLIAPNLTWETELSAIFGVKSADAYYMNNYPLYNYNGFSVTTYPKFYLINPRTYLSFVFMYRYLWATDIRTDWPDGGNGNGQLQDQYRNDFGLSARLGIMKRYGQFVVDYYLGAGIKYIMLHQLVYGMYEYHDSSQMIWYNPDHSPTVQDRIIYGPVVNLGIKIGFGF